MVKRSIRGIRVMRKLRKENENLKIIILVLICFIVALLWLQFTADNTCDCKTEELVKVARCYHWQECE